MPPFGSKATAVTLSQSQFMTDVQGRKTYKDWVGWTKATAGGQGLALALFEEQARTRDLDGFYKVASNPSRDLPMPPNSSIVFKTEADRNYLWAKVEGVLDMDLRLIKGRETFLTSLADQAAKGRLRTRLNGHVVPESKYYSPSAAKWTDMSVQAKVKAWPPPQPGPQSGKVAVDGSTKVKKWLLYEKNEGAKAAQGTPDPDRMWEAAVDQNVKAVGWPLGHDATKVKEIWKGLVGNVPAYRTGAEGSGVLYPSNFGGMSVLVKTMVGFANRPVPLRGNPAWEDWALFLFGAIMTSQAFTDGNKRIARAVYGIMIASGGIDLRVVNADIGKTIGPMNHADLK